jgi:hypothetical protein
MTCDSSDLVTFFWEGVAVTEPEEIAEHRGLAIRNRATRTNVTIAILAERFV